MECWGFLTRFFFAWDGWDVGWCVGMNGMEVEWLDDWKSWILDDGSYVLDSTGLTNVGCHDSIQDTGYLTITPHPHPFPADIFTTQYQSLPPEPIIHPHNLNRRWNFDGDWG